MLPKKPQNHFLKITRDAFAGQTGGRLELDEAGRSLKVPGTEIELKVMLVGGGPTVVKAMLALYRQGQNLTRQITVLPQVTANMADELRQDGIQFIDAAGNGFINQPPLYLFVMGNKAAKVSLTPATPRAFKQTGLRVLYALLCNPGLENETYRVIAEKTQVALGMVKCGPLSCHPQRQDDGRPGYRRRGRRLGGVPPIVGSTGCDEEVCPHQRTPSPEFEYFPLDIVPYGGISLDSQSISWPPDHQVIMNIMGFQEAYDYSVTVRVDDAPTLDVKLPTIPGMTLMKLIAWNDQYPGRPKDAEDILFLMENYTEAGNLDRLYGPESELLQDEGYDQTLAEIRLLGRDMGAMAATATGQAVKAILEAETGKQQRYCLVIDMVRSSRIRDRSDEVLAKLGKLTEGFFEGVGPKY